MAAPPEAGVAATRRRPIRWVAAGLGVAAAGTAHAQSNVEFRYLYYQESGGRTKVVNPWVFVNQDFGLRGGQLSFLLGYDAISGASPTGGYPTLDTTTSASGATSSSIPLAEYKDTRKSVTASYARKFGAHLPSVDLSYSKENDYTARGAGLTDAWTLAHGRGTLHLGLALSHDDVTPVTTRISQPKSSLAYALGWSWIVSEQDLLDVSASLTELNGYLTDPYKIVPVGTGTAPENRPDKRTRYAALFKYGHFFTEANAALKVSYRYYWDTWAIRAHTIELLYDKRLGSQWIVSPVVRLYSQSSASFFGNQFAVAQTYMSADYRLSSFESILGGLTLSYAIRPSLTLSVGATYQHQQGRNRETPLAAPLPPFTGFVPQDDGEGGGGGSPATVSAADLNVLTGTVGLSWRY